MFDIVHAQTRVKMFHYNSAWCLLRWYKKSCTLHWQGCMVVLQDGTFLCWRWFYVFVMIFLASSNLMVVNFKIMDEMCAVWLGDSSNKLLLMTFVCVCVLWLLYCLYVSNTKRVLWSVFVAGWLAFLGTYKQTSVLL